MAAGRISKRTAGGDLLSPGRARAYTPVRRVAWSVDGKCVASVSDDRSVRVWDVEHEQGHPRSGDGFGAPLRGAPEGFSRIQPTVTADDARGGRRLLWTGWGHSSRVWDVAFSRVGVVTAGEVGRPR